MAGRRSCGPLGGAKGAHAHGQAVRRRRRPGRASRDVVLGILRDIDGHRRRILPPASRTSRSSTAARRRAAPAQVHGSAAETSVTRTAATRARRRHPGAGPGPRMVAESGRRDAVGVAAVDR